MKLNISSSQEDFLKFCIFKLFFFKENISNPYFKELSDIYNVPEEKRWSLKISEEEKKEIISGSIEQNIFKENSFLLKNYREISEEFSSILREGVESFLSRYLNILESMFGSYDFEEVDLCLISTPIKMETKLLPAFVIKALPKKIFLSVKEGNIHKDDIIFYTKTFLHELGHVFLNNNQIFQKILLEEWKDKYRHIDSWNYRNIVEELLVSSIMFSYKDFGFAYSVLGLEEDLKEKEDSLNKNKFRVITFKFLESLKKSKEENKLEKLLPLFISELVEEGLFLEK